MMIKNSLKIFAVLFIVLFQFTGCMNNDDRKPIYFFYDEPVVVQQLGDHPFVRNQSHMFYVPDLVDDTNVKENDLLWTSFIVDLDDQDKLIDVLSYKAYSAKSFKYKKVDSAKVVIPVDVADFQSYLSDDYSAPIELSVLYNYTIDSLLFFGFIQADESNQLSHIYELVMNPEKEDSNYPTLYIRSKQTNIPGEHQAVDSQKRKIFIFAFDVTEFVNYYKENISSTNVIRFNLKYKTGVDSSGKDVYRSFMSNPISWSFVK